MKRVAIAQLQFDNKLRQLFYSDLDKGAIAIIPTDTLYGFAVAAHLPAAVARLYEIKDRDARKPLILFLNKLEQLSHKGFILSPELLQTLQKYWPGALTAILHKPEHQQLCAFTFAKIGVRIPAHRKLLQLLNDYQNKLLTTSANRSGEPSNCNPDRLADEFADDADWLIDDGILKPSLPSTVADFTLSPPVILRQGSLKLV